MTTARSKDGTTIAFERAGSGAPVILVDGALCYRGVGPNGPLAKVLARQFTVFTYDRRGRGESGDTAPYAVEREVEDLEAVIDTAGGSAHIYGISSGGALALDTARRLPKKVSRLALYEIPFVVDDTRPPAPEGFHEQLSELVSADRRGAAVKLFMREAVRLPGILVALGRVMPGWSKNTAVAHTLPYDVAIMGAGQSGKPLTGERWASVATPTLVVDGGKSPAWVGHAMEQLAEVLPAAHHRTLDGQRHYVKPAALAPVLEEFFR